MPVYSLVHAALLIALGVCSYFATDRVSPTALIPAAIGALFAAAGGIALAKPGALKHAMHAAAVLALATVAATGKGVVSTVQACRGVEIERPAAAYAMATAAALNVVFLALCIRSFRAARIRRQQALASGTQA